MELGVVYRDGSHGVPPDLERSFQCFCAAAGQGNAQAMTNLGALYMSGTLPLELSSTVMSPNSQGNDAENTRGRIGEKAGGPAANEQREQAVRREHDERGVICFLRAASMGVAEAVHNLNQLLQDQDDRELVFMMARQFLEVQSEAEVRSGLERLGLGL